MHNIFLHPRVNKKKVYKVKNPLKKDMEIFKSPRVRCTPVCRLCGRYLALLGRPIRVTVPAVTVAPTALVGSLIRSSNLPHSLQRGVHTIFHARSLQTSLLVAWSSSHLARKYTLLSHSYPWRILNYSSLQCLVQLVIYF